MRNVVVIAVVLVVALAGCSGGKGKGGKDDGASSTTGSMTNGMGGPGGNSTGTPVTNATGPPTLQLIGCANFGGVFPVPMADATAALPDGFTPVVSADDPAGGATLYILFLECDGSKVDAADSGPVSLAYAELAVVPPDAYRLPGITDYTVPLVFGAGSQVVGDQLALFRLGHAGQSTTTDVTDGAPGPKQARIVVDGITIDLKGQFAPGNANALLDGDFALIGVQDGVVQSVLKCSAHGGSALEGTVTQQSMGLPIFANARPVALGFSVQGFSLEFALTKTFAAIA